MGHDHWPRISSAGSIQPYSTSGRSGHDPEQDDDSGERRGLQSALDTPMKAASSETW